MFIEENKSVLGTRNHKGFQSILLTVERENIGKRIVEQRWYNSDIAGNLLSWGNEQGGPVSSRPCNKQCHPTPFGQPQSTKKAKKSKVSIYDLIYNIEVGEAFYLDTFMPLTLSIDIDCYKLTTGVYSPLPSGTVGIIWEEVCYFLQWFIVYHYIVNRHSKEKVRIMAYVRKDIHTEAGDSIAQMLLFPYIKGKATPV